MRRTGGKSTTRCTDLEMCDRRRTRNSSEAVRKSNYENVEHATQSERGKEKNREEAEEEEREEERKREIECVCEEGLKKELGKRACGRAKTQNSLFVAKSRDRTTHLKDVEK